MENVEDTNKVIGPYNLIYYTNGKEGKLERNVVGEYNVSDFEKLIDARAKK